MCSVEGNSYEGCLYDIPFIILHYLFTVSYKQALIAPRSRRCFIGNQLGTLDPGIRRSRSEYTARKVRHRKEAMAQKQIACNPHSVCARELAADGH